MDFILSCFSRKPPPPPPPPPLASKPPPLLDIHSIKIGDSLCVRDKKREKWTPGTVVEMDNELGPKILARGFESPYYYRWIRTPGCQEYEEEIERRWIEMYEKLDDEVENDGSALSLEFTEALANVATSDEKKLYDELFLPWDDDAGRQASCGDTARDANDDSLTYGEVLFDTFWVCILEKLRELGALEDNAAIFTDIGAGTAKPCFTAALFHPFKECRGIELLGDLCDLAQQIAERYHTVIRPRVGKSENDLRRCTEIRIEKADAFSPTCNWADSDVVFANTTCLPAHLCRLFEDKCNLLKPGSIVVMTTKRLSFQRCPSFETLDVGVLKEDCELDRDNFFEISARELAQASYIVNMTHLLRHLFACSIGGSATVYFHRKLNEGQICGREGYSKQEEEMARQAAAKSKECVSDCDPSSGSDDDEGECGDNYGAVSGYWGPMEI